MAHFAKLDSNNIVIEVNVVNNDMLLDENGVESEYQGIRFLMDWSGGYGNWRQTSYNANFRKNFAAIGYSYDPKRDAFIPPQLYPSWVLNEDTCQWQAPVPYPTDAATLDDYDWNEETRSWVRVTAP